MLFVCPNGDFGRVRPSLLTDDIHAWVGRDAARDYGAPVSLFPLTDDERLLRDLAYPLIEPAYDRQRWYSVLGEYGMTYYFRPEWYNCDQTAYAARMMTAYVRSETTRYFRLNDDVRNDVLPPRSVRHGRTAGGRHRPQARAERRLRLDPERPARSPICQSRIGENTLTVGLGAALAGRTRGVLSVRT